MVKKIENNIVTKRLFGVPAHTNKVLQLLYTFVSINFVLNTSILLLLKERIRSIIATIGIKTPQMTNSKAIQLLSFFAPAALASLFVWSLIRVTSNIENCHNTFYNTTKYSKCNNFLYFGAGGITLLSLVFPIYSFLAEIAVPPCEVYGINFTPVEIMYCISSIMLLFALTMSLISTIAPQLTRPEPFIPYEKLQDTPTTTDVVSIEAISNNTHQQHH